MSIEMQVSTAPSVELSAEQALVLNAVSPRIKSVEHSGTNTVVIIEDINGDHTINIPDGQQGPQGEQGVQGEQGIQGETGATGNGIASVTLNADYTLTITYTNGQSVTTTSIRGEKGETGSTGATGADGYSPTVTVTDITGGHRVSVTDKNGTQTFDVLDGQDGTDGTDGTDGVSPTVSVTDISGGHTVTITDAEHPSGQSFNVMDGTNGQDGRGVPSGGTQGQMLVKKTGTDYDTEWANPPSVPVTDVQVNGTSVLSSGVANVPVASPTNYGVTKTQAPYRLIKTFAITQNLYSIYINRDDNNQEFALTDAIVLFSGVLSNGTGNCAISCNNGQAIGDSSDTAAFVTMRNGFSTTAQTRTAEMHIQGGRFFGYAMSGSTTNRYAPVYIDQNRNSTGVVECGPIYELFIKCLNYYYVSEGTITIYGR